MPSSPAINMGVAVETAKKKQLTRILDKAISRKEKKPKQRDKDKEDDHSAVRR
jgi:hypothetical protein